METNDSEFRRMISFFIGAWLSMSSLPGQSDTTSVVLVEWWYTSDINIASDITRYSIVDSIKEYKIYSAYRVYFVREGIPVTTYLFGLIIEKIPHKTFLYCVVEDYETDYFYHWGFSLIPGKPTNVGIRE